MPLLGLPLALFGLTALPALAAIYWLRTRFRRQQVSSLLLWTAAAQAQGGGRRASRLQTPLAFLLELLAIVLLVLAATMPQVLRADTSIPVVVVLDDSYSMSALRKDGRPVRDHAIDTLTNELDALGRYTARIITAGAQPALQGRPVSSAAAAREALQDWQPQSATADLDAATALAREVGGPRARVLILTDHPANNTEPNETPENPQANDETLGGKITETLALADRVRWCAVGEARANLGIINAVRSQDAQQDNVLIEIVNHSTQPQTTNLTLAIGQPPSQSTADESTDTLGPLRTLEQRPLTLAPGELRQLRFRLESVSDRPVIAQLQSDALPADNTATLMPASRPPLPVAITIRDARLSSAVVAAVEASEIATLDTSTPQLVFTDQPKPPGPTKTDAASPPWRIVFNTPQTENTRAYTGPFVIDFSHPATAGISLAGVVWAADPQTKPPGHPIVSTGSIPLLTEQRVVSSRGIGDLRTLTLHLKPQRSTLLSSPAWPVLISNVIAWRQAALPGISTTNVRVGIPITLRPTPNTTPPDQDPTHTAIVSRIHEPENPTTPTTAKPLEITLRDGLAIITPDRPGTYRINVGEERFWFSAHALSSEESDLRTAATRTTGSWHGDEELVQEYRGLSWLLGLLALTLLGAHAWLLYGPNPATIRAAHGGAP